MLSLLTLFVAVLCLSPTNSQSFNPLTPCFIHLSNTREACYYYPTSGFDCEFCTSFPNNCLNVDTTRRNLTMCGNSGHCYTPLALLYEICYYTQPYGYNCFYEPDLSNLSNLTVCVDLKANTAPDLEFVAGNNPSRTTQEDIAALIDIVSIDDIDADESIAEGKGHLTLELSITNGFVALIPAAAASGPDRAAAEDVLVDNLNDRNNGVEFVDLGSGINGSYAAAITMIGRQGALKDALKALVFKPNPNYNTYRAPGNLVLTVAVNDNGNTGGVSETVIRTASLTASPVNDIPIITVPSQPAMDEDTPRTLSGISISDVDQLDAGGDSFTMSLVVTEGNLTITDLLGTSDFTPDNLRSEILLYGSMDDLNLVLADKIVYDPDHHFNGDDVLTIYVDDGGHIGAGGPTTVSVTTTLTTTAINDEPTIHVSSTPLVVTTEDTAVALTGISIADVDSAGALTITITGLSSGSVAPGPVPVSLVVSVGDRNNALGSAGTTPSGPVVFTPDKDFSGTVFADLVVSDGVVASPTTTIEILVESVNDPPVLCINVGATVNSGGQPNPDITSTDACVDLGPPATAFAVKVQPGPLGTWADVGLPQSRRYQVGTSSTGFKGTDFNHAVTTATRLLHYQTGSISQNALPRVQIGDVDAVGDVSVLVVVTGGGAAITWQSGIPTDITELFSDTENVLLYFSGSLADVNDAIQNEVRYTSPTPFDHTTPDTAEVILCASDNASSGDTSPDGFSVCFEITITAVA